MVFELYIYTIGAEKTVYVITILNGQYRRIVPKKSQDKNNIDIISHYYIVYATLNYLFINGANETWAFLRST